MHKFFLCILFFVLLALPAICYSQYNDTAATVTVEPPDEDEPETNTSGFSLVTQKEPVEIKTLPKEKIEELKKDDAYWYANADPVKKQKKTTTENDSASGDGWLPNLLWIIILCSFIAVVIWYLASSNVALFRKESKKIIDEGPAEEWQEDIFSINYQKEIQKAVDAANYRLAVRLWYLQTLKELASRNIIDYRHERSNSHYLSVLFGGRYYKDFFRLTRNFEYTWYGQFNLSAEAYQMMQADFTKFKKGLS